ncbi:hypothetical protein NUM3379_06120 [Kineococcus sp. NUM-3379]
MRPGNDSTDPFTTIFVASPVPIGLCARGVFIAVNPAMCELLGRPESELLGSSTVPFTHPDDLHTNRNIAAMLESARARGERAVQLEKRYVRPGGEIVWAWLTVTVTTGAAGEEWTLMHAQDITARKAAEEALRSSEANLAALNRIARRVQAGEDPRQEIIDSARAVSGAGFVALCEPQGGEGPAALRVTAATDPGAVGAQVQLGSASATSHCYLSGDVVLVPDCSADPRAGQDLPQVAAARSVLCSPLRTTGLVSAVLVVCWREQVALVEERPARALLMLAAGASAALEHARVVAELEASAVTDALTGLPNRRGWEEHLTRLAAACAREGRPLTVAVLDVDRFKLYNDTEGHLAGDRLLAEVARLVARELRGSDVVARWGGEEFALALPDCSAEAALPILERVRLAVRDARTCSIGYATRRGAEPFADLLCRADAALYAAKQAGRDRVLDAGTLEARAVEARGCAPEPGTRPRFPTQPGADRPDPAVWYGSRDR